ncbi:hypothetical protein [uncultured Roseibium sp.]|uniref:hypothetical protein n=1 Tax=uncultured Roseibium sp. TaxID=1936171 RepID=UPI003217E2ED
MNRRHFIVGSGLCALLPLASGLSLEAAHAEDTIKLRKLYNKDLSYSDYALSMEDKRVSVSGFMAPPLKAESKFFVLTRRPMAVCPFCETEADWPDDILAIYTKRIIDVVSFNTKIITRGTLKLGSFTDPETGFLSRVRLVDASYERP